MPHLHKLLNIHITVFNNMHVLMRKIFRADEYKYLPLFIKTFPEWSFSFPKRLF